MLIYLTMNVLLNDVETRHVDQHGHMSPALASQMPRHARQEERIHGLDQRWRQTIATVIQRSVSVLVRRGHPPTVPILRFVIFNGARQRQTALTPIAGHQAKQLRRADVVGRRSQIDDERRWKQVWP